MATWRALIRYLHDTDDVHYDDDELTADDVAGVKALTAVTNALTAAKTAHTDGVAMKIYEKHSETVWELEDTTYHLPGSTIKFYGLATHMLPGTTEAINLAPEIEEDDNVNAGVIQVGATRAEAPVNNLYVWTDGIEDEDISWTISAPNANIFLTATTGDLVDAYVTSFHPTQGYLIVPNTQEELDELEAIKLRKINIEIQAGSLSDGDTATTTNTVAVGATQVGNYVYDAVTATEVTIIFNVVAAGG